MSNEVSSNKHRYKRTVSVDPEEQQQFERDTNQQDGFLNQNGFSDKKNSSSYPEPKPTYVDSHSNRRNVMAMTDSERRSRESNMKYDEEQTCHSSPRTALQNDRSPSEDNSFQQRSSRDKQKHKEHRNQSSLMNGKRSPEQATFHDQDRREPFYETSTFRIKVPNAESKVDDRIKVPRAESKVDDRIISPEVPHYHDVGLRSVNQIPPNKEKYLPNDYESKCSVSSSSGRKNYLNPSLHPRMSTTNSSYEKYLPENKKTRTRRSDTKQSSVKDLIGVYSSLSQGDGNTLSHAKTRRSLLSRSTPYLNESAISYSSTEEMDATTNAEGRRKNYKEAGRQQWSPQTPPKANQTRLVHSSRSPSGKSKRRREIEQFAVHSPRRSSSLPNSPSHSRRSSVSSIPDVSLVVKHMSSFPSGAMTDSQEDSLDEHINQYFSESNLRKLSVDGQSYRPSKQNENPSSDPARRCTLWRSHSDQSLIKKNDESAACSATTRRSFPENNSKELHRNGYGKTESVHNYNKNRSQPLQRPQDSIWQRNQNIPKNVHLPSGGVRNSPEAQNMLKETTTIPKSDPGNAQHIPVSHQGVALHVSSKEPATRQACRTSLENSNISELFPKLDVTSPETLEAHTAHQPITSHQLISGTSNQENHITLQDTERKYSSGIPQGFIDGMHSGYPPNNVNTPVVFSLSSSTQGYSNQTPILSSSTNVHPNQSPMPISPNGCENQIAFTNGHTNQTFINSSSIGGYPNQISIPPPLSGGHLNEMTFPTSSSARYQMPVPQSSHRGHLPQIPIPPSSLGGHPNQMPIPFQSVGDRSNEMSIPSSFPGGYSNQICVQSSSSGGHPNKMPISPTSTNGFAIQMHIPPVLRASSPNHFTIPSPGCYANQMPVPCPPNQMPVPRPPNQVSIPPLSPGEHSNKIQFPSLPPNTYGNQMPIPSSSRNDCSHQMPNPLPCPDEYCNQISIPSPFPNGDSSTEAQFSTSQSFVIGYSDQTKARGSESNAMKPNTSSATAPFQTPRATSPATYKSKTNINIDSTNRSSLNIFISDSTTKNLQDDIPKDSTKQKPDDVFDNSSSLSVPQAVSKVKPYDAGFGQVQDFYRIRDDCLKNGTLWKDPSFLASESSVTSSSLTSVPIQWKRPGEIARNPRLFVDGASRFDVVQGELGDCWLLAAVANLTLNPSLFHHVVPRDQSFASNYAGIFHFRFWQYGEWVDVVIDDSLPTYGGQLLFLHSKETNEFWSALLEKAYAKIHGSYEALKGGTSAEAMEDFSGGLTELYMGEEIPSNFCNVLLKAHERSSFITCSLEKDPKINEKHLANGLIRGHAYSVTGIKRIEVKSGGTIVLIRIRNPWGNEVEWKGPWADQSPEWNTIRKSDQKAIDLTFDKDGEFWMSYDDFIKNFEKIDICHLNPNSLHKKYNKQWQTQIFEGQWVKGVTAGGCRNYLETFWHNPQFRITLEEPDEHDGKCTIIVAVMQKHRRRQREDYATIGFTIYQLKNSEALPKPLDYNFFKTNISVARSPSFVNTREVLCRFLLPAATYCIIPSTYEPNQEGQFIIRVFSEKRNTMQKHDEDIGTKIVEKVNEVREEDEKHVIASFLKLANKNREVDSIKLKQLLDHAFSREFTSDGVSVDVCRSLVAMMDDDHSGKLSLHEFLTLWKDVRRWKTVFQLYDKDHSGSLNTFELREALNSAGYRLNSHILTVLTLRYGPEGKIACDDFIMCAVKLKIIIGTFRRKTRKKKNSAKFSLEEWIETTMYC